MFGLQFFSVMIMRTTPHNGGLGQLRLRHVVERVNAAIQEASRPGYSSGS
jgi:hypothetical protein